MRGKCWNNLAWQRPVNCLNFMQQREKWFNFVLIQCYDKNYSRPTDNAAKWGVLWNLCITKHQVFSTANFCTGRRRFWQGNSSVHPPKKEQMIVSPPVGETVSTIWFSTQLADTFRRLLHYEKCPLFPDQIIFPPEMSAVSVHFSTALEGSIDSSKMNILLILSG